MTISFVKKIWDKFIYEGYLIALGDISALAAFSIILGIRISWDFLLVIFFIIFSLLTYNYYGEMEYDKVSNPERVKIIKKRKATLPFIIASIFLTLFLTWYFSSLKALLVLLGIYLVGSVYTWKMKKLTANVAGFKSFYVALSYPLLTLFLVIYYGNPITFSVLILYLFYSMRIFINTVFCDVRDIASDKLEGLKTFPILLGEKKTRLVLSFLNILSVIPILVGIYLGFLPLFSIGLLLTIVFIFYCLLIYGSKAERVHNSYIFNILVEGEFLFWLPLVLISKNYLFM